VNPRRPARPSLSAKHDGHAHPGIHDTPWGSRDVSVTDPFGNPERQTNASPERRRLCVAREPGVQPALSGQAVRWMVLVTRTAARAKRLASARNASGCSRAPLLAASRWYAVQGLFFGDFLLAPQKKTEGFGEAKVTPPPGGTPGNAPSSRTLRKGNPTARAERSIQIPRRQPHLMQQLPRPRRHQMPLTRDDPERVHVARQLDRQDGQHVQRRVVARHFHRHHVQ
jgi:hypothetical protein